MRRTSLAGLVVGSFLPLCAPLAAQELEETFCENAPNCSDDNLSLIFEGAGANGNVFTYSEFTPDMEVTATVRMNSVSPGIQGWSLAVRHTDGDLLIPDDGLTMDGTDGGAALSDFPFARNTIVMNVVDGETRVGFISAVVLDLNAVNTLPPGDRSLVRVTYRVLRDVGPDGTVARLADKELGVQTSPPVDINVTADGARSLLPRLLTHGQIRKTATQCVPTAASEVPGETCDDGIDNDCDDLIDAADPDCAAVSPGCPEGTPADALYFGAVGGDQQADGNAVAVVARNAADLLGFSFGVSVQVAGDSQTWSFSGELGNNDRAGNPVLVDLNFTGSDGSSVAPVAGNSVTATAAEPITGVARGSATEGFAGDDFFAVDLDPDLGGDGFFVGYVASLAGDTSKVVPATPSPQDECPSSELVTITVGGGVRFNRGDANGDGAINVTDGVLVIQNIAGGLPAGFPNCPAILDVNGDGTNDLADGVFLLSYIFRKDSPVPPAPFRTCEAGAGECAESNCAG